MKSEGKRFGNIWLLVLMLTVFGMVEGISYLLRTSGYAGRLAVFYFRSLEIIVWVGIWGFRSGKEWLKNLSLAFVATTGILLVLDLIFFVLTLFNSPDKYHKKLYPKEAVDDFSDKNIGYKPPANASILWTQDYDTVHIFKFRFTTDAYSRRINPYDTAKSKSKYALFFGCSVTFGQGVNDSETIPARFAEYNPGYHSYNFAYAGYGTQQMLANLQKKDIRNQVSEANGAAFYIFINPHINRDIGDMQTYDAWGAEMPYFYEKGDTLIRKGSFRSGRPFLSALYTILGRSALLKYFKFNLPFRLSEKDYRLAAEMIKESQNQYIKKFGNDRFYVLIFPGESLEIVPWLNKYHIKYLDYSRLFERNSKENSYLPYDGHPRAKADEIFAKRLSKDVDLIMNKDGKK